MHLRKPFIVEEGEHSKNEETRRGKLAEEHNVYLYFIPYNAKFYKNHPEAVDGVITEIKTKIKSITNI